MTNAGFFTTLQRLRQCSPEFDFNRLLNYLGKTEADDEPLSLRTVLESNGIEDAILALESIDACPERKLFAVRCVRQLAQHLLNDARSLNALDVVELHAIGEATDEELKAALAAARDAARDVAQSAAREAWAARVAALVARDALAALAAQSAAGDAARAAVWAAVAAQSAAGDAARAAAEDAWNSIEQDFREIFCSSEKSKPKTATASALEKLNGAWCGGCGHVDDCDEADQAVKKRLERLEKEADWLALVLANAGCGMPLSEYIEENVNCMSPPTPEHWREAARKAVSKSNGLSLNEQAHFLYIACRHTTNPEICPVVVMQDLKYPCPFAPHDGRHCKNVTQDMWYEVLKNREMPDD